MALQQAAQSGIVGVPPGHPHHIKEEPRRSESRHSLVDVKKHERAPSRQQVTPSPRPRPAEGGPPSSEPDNPNKRARVEAPPQQQQPPPQQPPPPAQPDVNGDKSDDDELVVDVSTLSQSPFYFDTNY